MQYNTVALKGRASVPPLESVVNVWLCDPAELVVLVIVPCGVTNEEPPPEREENPVFVSSTTCVWLPSVDVVPVCVCAAF